MKSSQRLCRWQRSTRRLTVDEYYVLHSTNTTYRCIRCGVRNYRIRNTASFHRKHGVGIIFISNCFTGNVVWLHSQLFHRKHGVGAIWIIMYFIGNVVWFTNLTQVFRLHKLQTGLQSGLRLNISHHYDSKDEYCVSSVSICGQNRV